MMLKRKRYFLSCRFIILLLFISGNITAEVRENIRKSTEVGVVIRAGSPVFANPRSRSTMIRKSTLGDVFVLLKKSSDHNQEYREIVFSTGKIGWMSARHIQAVPVHFVNGAGKKNNYPLFDSISGKKILAEKQKDDRFFVNEILLTEGEPAARMFKVTYETRTPSGFKPLDSGWVKASDVVLSFELVYLAVGKHRPGWTEGGGWHTLDLETSKKIFTLMLDRYPGIFFKDRADEIEFQTRHSSVEALSNLASIYTAQKQYATAIEAYNRIIREFPGIYSGGGRSEPFAYTKIAEIYRVYMSEPQKALDIYQRIIKNFPKEEVWSFESNSTFDINAVFGIGSIGEQYKLEKDFMLKQYREAIDHSTFPVVKMIATLKRARLLRKEKKFQLAIKELYDALKKYPSTTMTYYKTTVDYSVDALERILDIYTKDLHQYKEAVKICRDLFTEHRNQDLGKAARYFSIEILDNTFGNREEVIKAYDLFVKDYREWYVRCQRDNGYIGGSKALNRLKEIRAFLPVKMAAGQTVTLYERPDVQAAEIAAINKGSSITALYNKKNRGIKWLKVSLEDNRLVWVQERPFTIKSKSPDAKNIWYTPWPVWGGRRSNSRCIPGRRIRSPQLKMDFPGLWATEILFCDVNGDSRPDMVVYGKNITLLNGKNGEVLWNLEIENYSRTAPFIHKNILFCSSREILAAVDLKSGELKWKSSSGPGVEQISSPTASGTSVYVVTRDGVLCAFDIHTGVKKWKMKLGKGVYYSEPVVEGDKLYCGVDVKKGYSCMMCVHLVERKILYTPKFSFPGTPVVSGDTLLFPGGGSIYAIDILTGETKWEFKTGATVVSPAVSKETVCIVSQDNSLNAVDIATGEPVWSVKGKGTLRASPCIVGGIVYAASCEGKIYAFRIRDGIMLWEFETGVPIFPLGYSLSAAGPFIAVISQEKGIFFIGEKSESGAR